MKPWLWISVLSEILPAKLLTSLNTPLAEWTKSEKENADFGLNISRASVYVAEIMSSGNVDLEALIGLPPALKKWLLLASCG